MSGSKGSRRAPAARRARGPRARVAACAGAGACTRTAARVAACELVAATSTSTKPSKTAHRAARSGRKPERSWRRRGGASGRRAPGAGCSARRRGRDRDGPAGGGGRGDAVAPGRSVAPGRRGAGAVGGAGGGRWRWPATSAPSSLDASDGRLNMSSSEPSSHASTWRARSGSARRRLLAAYTVLFLSLAGLADGLAPKERRYALQAISPNNLGPPLPFASPGKGDGAAGIQLYGRGILAAAPDRGAGVGRRPVERTTATPCRRPWRRTPRPWPRPAAGRPGRASSRTRGTTAGLPGGGFCRQPLLIVLR